MPDIHSTAIVEDSVQLASDVVVGPHCVLRGQVTVGPGCRFIGNVYLEGPLTLGAGNLVYPFACLGFAPQDLKYDFNRPGPGVIIGDRNTFREGSTVHRATGDRPTTIGSDNLFMAQSHVGHDGVVGNRCVLANSAVVGGHGLLQDNVIIGGFGGTHQFCRVGRLAMISGLVAVVKDLPPFCVAYTLRRVGSLNLVGLRRAGYRQNIPHLKAAFDILYRQGHSNSVAARLIQDQLGHDPLCVELAQFVAATRRGITILKGARRPTDDDDES